MRGRRRYARGYTEGRGEEDPPAGQVRTDAFAPGAVTQTDFGYTGQRNVGDLGLMDYKARFYDPALGRFTQPDTIVPNAADPQSWNRYTYVVNNPLRFVDPSGQRVACGVMGEACESESMPGFKPSPRARRDNDNRGFGEAYLLGWSNFGGALSIYSSPSATGTQRFGAGLYLGAWGGAHVGLALGLAGLGCAVAGPGCAAAVEGTLGIGATLDADGDPTNEIQALGRAGEAAAGIIKNTRRIPSLSGTASYRIPDQLLSDSRLISEVKNVARLSLTNQIRDFALFASQGYNFELWTRDTTRLSGPLQGLVDAGQIIQRFLP